MSRYYEMDDFNPSTRLSGKARCDYLGGYTEGYDDGYIDGWTDYTGR